MTSPLDPEIIKVPAFKRRRSLSARSRQPIPWTALNRKEMGMSLHDIGAAIPDEASSVKSVARATRNVKRVLTPSLHAPTLHDSHISNFQRISLQQTSMLDESSSEISREYGLIGTVTLVLTNISVGILALTQSLRLGDRLLFEGEGCMFEEVVSEMQIAHKNVKTAKKGAEIGLKMKKLPCSSTKVYRVSRS